MAGRGKTSFQKRRNEQMRLERRQEKAARKLERKALKDGSPAASGHESRPPAPGPKGSKLRFADRDLP